MLLDDKVAVISGAASARGIGLATARLFRSRTARKSPFSTCSEAQAKEALRAWRGASRNRM